MPENKQLTQERAERCAKACGWKKSKDGPSWNWWISDEGAIYPTVDLPKSNYFWRPRLEDALHVIASVHWFELSFHETVFEVKMFAKRVGYYETFSAETPEEALCLAIEVLKKEADHESA